MQTVIEVKVIDLIILFVLALILMVILAALLYAAGRDYLEYRRYKARAKRNRKRGDRKNESWIEL